jgi:hypothetical protein
VLLARREEWVAECKGLETANETTERTKTRSEVGLRMAGDSRRKRSGKEKSGTTGSPGRRRWEVTTYK